MAALEKIVKWSQTLPAWQSDAARRILTQDVLTEKDILDVLAILKAAHGIVDPESSPSKPIRLELKHLSGNADSSSGVILKRLQIGDNVNAIEAGSEILFGHEGVTVIYGENAAGKSGYARVLKRACKARDVKEEILPDIYSNPSGNPASAAITISVDGQSDKRLEWTDGASDFDELAAIAVFDSHCARVIVNEKNEPIYLPYGAIVFESLAKLLGEIRKVLESEKPLTAVPAFSDVDTSTWAGKWLDKLRKKTIRDRVKRICVWPESKVQKLRDVTQRISNAESGDPQTKIRSLRQLETNIREFIDETKKIDNALSGKKETELRQKIDQVIDTRNAVDELAKTLENQPLAGAGRGPWVQLYEAAKKYSTEVAYPARQFPFTDEESRCVLCMQPVSTDARTRFADFTEFMDGETKQRANDACEAIKKVAEELKEVDFAPLESRKNLVDNVRDRDEKLADRLKEYSLAVSDRSRTFLKVCEEQTYDKFPKLEQNPNNDLTKLADQIGNEARQLEDALDPGRLDQLKTRQIELLARRALANHTMEILQYIQDLHLASCYDDCLGETNPRNISDQGKKIISEALSPELLKALGNELGDLGADQLPLIVRTIAEKGETLHCLSLKGAKLPKKKGLADVLSEGEHRVVAIAGFLAELNLVERKNPIVFDDPVSSLDHHYRDRIARRLSRESLVRQVIVFTHDIAFLLELRQAISEMNGKWSIVTVARSAGKPGKILMGEPWEARPVAECCKFLDNHLNSSRKLYADNMPEYNTRAGEFYGRLRETWERCVEEILLNNVVRSHGAEVQTLRLKEVEITTEDWKTVDVEMGKCSKWMIGHRKSAAIDTNRPPPKEAEEALTVLREYIKKVNKRKDKVRKTRKVAMQPQESKIG